MASDEYHRRTLITRLTLRNDEDEQLLLDTIEEWLDGCNIASTLAWNTCHTKSDVRQLAKQQIKQETKLGDQHATLACHEVAGAIKSCIECRKNGKKASQPQFTSRSMTFDRRTLTVFPDQETVTLTTLGNHSRVHADLSLPEAEDGYQRVYLDSDEWEYTESTLHYRDGDWYIHLGYRTPKEDDDSESPTENGTVLGVDLGVNQIAVTSTARFFDADELNHYRREFEKTRGSLQQTGTQSAHRTIESLSGREERYVKHVLHNVANGIIEEALEHDCDGIVFEELDGIREDLPEAAWHSEWAFRKLKDFVEYKAEFEGLFVDTTNPRNTSKRCNECGFTHDDNRHAGQFECQSCGRTNHADYNAAKNVAELYLRRGHQSSGRRSVSQYALKSGARTPS
ncbi:RNA-guided endonuclease InsQ/TnpB family protein [Natronorubrum bangense]|uniref:Transposase, IS605 OrfB family protein n=2 Tax=Natronorubrum bangense TaxID=61858 RepID=L9WSM5_9EURY|nr:RNA-guided endonuclease TnpB family protein [Natronorubrum bangense]ELY52211.1 transposase, IS605 OrfB family protein [Natronorubrum bangense JCM 10635]QCC55317.1 transposase [Natronorubrum bangense]